MTQPIDPAAYAAFLAYQQQQQQAAAAQVQVQQPQFQQMPQYPPQHYAQPMQVQPAPPPPAPTVAVSLVDAYQQSQRVVGAGLFKGTDPIGTAFVGVVRAQATAEQMTDFDTKAPLFHKDMRPKVQVLVPLTVQQTDRHPEGTAVHYVKGEELAEMNRALAAAGLTKEEILQGPEVGAVVRITYIGDRPNRKGNPTKLRAWEYTRPNGNTPPTPEPAVPLPAGGVANALAHNIPLAPGQMAPTVAPAAPVVTPPAPVAPPATPAPVAAAPVLAVPEGLTPEQAAKFLELTGQKPAA